MKKVTLITVFTILLLSLSTCGSSVPANQGTVSSATAGKAFFTGDGGKGKSITIYAPKATGLAENEANIPTVVHREFINNFSGYSAISVTDWESVEELYARLLSGYYADDAEAGMDLGHLIPTDYYMEGNITRTSTGYALQYSIIKTTDKTIAAPYSGICTFEELNNFSGVRRASLDLLQKMGVTLTEQAKTELAGAAAQNHVNAQTSFASSVTFQRQGNQVAALAFSDYAAALDPTMTDAVKRSSVMVANISSGNIGANTLAELEWYDAWKAKLIETEQFIADVVNTSDLPYVLFFSDGIEWGQLNVQTRTRDASFPLNLRANRAWLNSVAQAVNAVYDGLVATGKKNDWGRNDSNMRDWPQRSYSSTNPFTSRNDISIVFELVGDQDRVLGRETVRITPSFSFSPRNNKIVPNYESNTFRTVTFKNISANDIDSVRNIRVVSVKGIAPENARFRITFLPDAKWKEYRDGYSHLRVENGVLLGFDKSIIVTERRYVSGSYINYFKFNPKLSESQIQQYRNLVIPADLWGEPFITSIGQSAFEVQSISENTQIISVNIPNSVTSIGDYAFFLDEMLVTNQLTSINIGSNVTIGRHAFGRITFFASLVYLIPSRGFEKFYESNGKKAGTYTYNNRKWSYSP
jgi:hypothetical protein